MKRKILIVDDEIIILKCILVDLRRFDYSVDTAENGNQALAMLEKEKYDLVITDLMMEDMGGLELLAEIKKKTADMPVIIMTGYGELDSAIEALRLGASDYLLKPCNNEELILRVGNCIDKVELQKKVKFYESILPICSVCKKIRDDAGKGRGDGDWKPLEEYLAQNVGLDLSHGICPECSDKLYGDQEWYKENRDES
ncbi:MAG: sigma-54-dependent Fis family transcriptional regulator [Desulfobulbaceae bacterium]|nr:sigma-54-dependent Fis family transcriptional regulator [Desulfobulbaceae bacterium]